MDDKYWKDPRLDDEGTYDYLVEELPRDYAKWEFTKHKFKCDDCGKESRLRFVSAHYFYCWDGWDSMSYDVCWKCALHDKVHSIIYGIKHYFKTQIKVWKYAIETYQIYKKAGVKQVSFKRCYKLAKQIERGQQ